MKSFKEIVKETTLNEGGEMYPADEMTMKELKIACYAAQNILDRLEDGAMIQRWQISAIVKAKEELASVYTSMSADEDDEEWDDEEDDDTMYVGFEYPSMYGEEAEIDETNESLNDIVWAKNVIKPGTTRTLNKKYKPGDKVKYAGNTSTVVNHDDKGFVTLSNPAWSKNRIVPHTSIKEELDFKVSVDGLPDMYVKGNSPAEVKTNLRKVIKKPDSIQSVDRVTQAMLKKIFRNKAMGKEEIEEESLQEAQKFGKKIGEVNGYHIHDLGADTQHKSKRFLAYANHYGWISHARATRKEAEDEAKKLPTSKTEIKSKSDQERDDWRETQKQRIQSGEIRKAVMSRKMNKEEIQEGYNDPIHRKYISDAVHEYVSKTDEKHDKIVDHLHKAKNFGNKTSDSLESHAGISTGAAKRITKAVSDHLKANFGSPSKTQTQSQRVDRYLKQKWVKPR
jgi:hypothetical protein